MDAIIVWVAGKLLKNEQQQADVHQFLQWGRPDIARKYLLIMIKYGYRTKGIKFEAATEYCNLLQTTLAELQDFPQISTHPALK